MGDKRHSWLFQVVNSRFRYNGYMQKNNASLAPTEHFDHWSIIGRLAASLFHEIKNEVDDQETKKNNESFYPFGIN